MFGLFLGGIIIGILIIIALLKMTASDEPIGCIAIISLLALLLFSALIIVSKLLSGA